jgi:CRP-like cAMP-binding protein
LLKVDQDHFHDILFQNADVALAIIRTLTRRLRSMDGKPSPGASGRQEAEATPG